MKFGSVPLAQAEGGLLAHSVKAGEVRLRKGMVLEAEALRALAKAGITDVVIARLEQDDLHEDTAAAELARALVPDPDAAGLRVTVPFTGRVNLVATGPGVVMLDVPALEAFNAVNPMITIATVPPFQQMAAGGMVATIKIISYGVPAADVERAAALVAGAIRLEPPRLSSAALILTDIPGGPPSDKGRHAITARVDALGLSLTDLRTVDHAADPLAQALREVQGDLALILTASATSDVNDVAPDAVRRAGGVVDRFGMPVDPGNLLFIGHQGGRPVIGLPGCARSPALNGADWVLSRIACGIEVSAADISGMGVGGLLKEIPTRPQPRAGRRAR